MPTCTFHSGHLATINGSSQHVSASCSVLKRIIVFVVLWFLWFRYRNDRYRQQIL